ncbi:MAG: glycosyltransferase family 2 protein [Lachnospiraceae bacterium]|nr:glycosyltransferase family 2 protein [Lachnospiraceae bacterium]
MTDVSFVIPCYNEEGNVAAIFDAIHAVFDPEGISVETVFVNDGSKDGTKEALDRLYESCSGKANIRVIHFSRNFGKEAAILAGLQHAEAARYCLIDADLQQRPEVALQMYRILDEDPEKDMAAAYQEKRHEGKVLSFFKKCFYGLINRMTNVPFREGASDFRMFRENVRSAILSMTEYYRFTKGIFAFIGFDTVFIPYEAEERYSGKTSWSFTKLFRYAVEGILGYTTKPLLFPFTLSVILFFAAVIYLVLRHVIGNALHVPADGSVAVITLILALASLLFAVLGIFGLYLSKTYMQGKDRPVYIVKEILEGNKNDADSEKGRQDI